MYYVMRASAPSLHRESTDSLIYKTQLICFRSRQTHPCTANIAFNNIKLKFQDEITHLGHIIVSYNLDDRKDIYSPCN